MKNDSLKKRLIATVALLLAISMTLSSCKNDIPPDSTGKETETENSIESETEKATETDPSIPASAKDHSMTSYSNLGSTKIDYSKYLSLPVVEKVLAENEAIAISESKKAYVKDGYKTASSSVASRRNFTLTVNAAALSEITGKTIPGEKITPEEAAKALGMNYILFDARLVIFYNGDKEIFNTFTDVYNLEYFTMTLCGADETELKNAFVTLPVSVSNGSTNTTYYNSPDLNLGLQTTMYDLVMGGPYNVEKGPAIVAGEGNHSENHTLVRVFNEYQAPVTQFLAYDVSVKGGVQVAAVNDGGVHIATAAFDNSTGKAGNIRIFGVDGSLTMEFTPEKIKAPFRIAAGKFKGVSNDMLIVTSSAPVNGKLPVEVYSIGSKKLVASYEIDASFAKADENITLSMKRGQEEDSLIIYFEKSAAAYEGTLSSGHFKKISADLPEGTNGIYPSAYSDYVATVDEAKTKKDISYLAQITGGKATMLDVGKKENTFYSNLVENSNNPYLQNAVFKHMRTEEQSKITNVLRIEKKYEKTFNALREAKYKDYDVTAFDGTYKSVTSTTNFFAEPTFAYRNHGSIKYTKVLMGYESPLHDGANIYSGVSRTGKISTYQEFTTTYYTTTFADGTVEMNKFRLYPLRHYLQKSAKNYRASDIDPEKLVGISPVHEHEINIIENSVGDYNAMMIEGFRNYLISIYGTVENINKVFGTEFKSYEEIDAPRNRALGNRGKWDLYRGDYFTEWVLYNRQMVQKRIAESYREAMMAGFPPEMITAHSIPEGDAVSGFLGQADTRLSPIDALMTLGTSYGGTRYGVFYSDSNNFIAVANLAGHHSMAIGEYSSLQTNKNTAKKQLEWLYNNGVKMIHCLEVVGNQRPTEFAAMAELAEDINNPRPGYAGGTAANIAVNDGKKKYDIALLGTGSEHEGLLKSLDEDGTFEGTVYLVPFHSHINVSKIDLALNSGKASTGVIKELYHGDQVELTWLASSASGAEVKVEVYKDGYLVKDASAEYTITPETKSYRYVYSAQLAHEIEIKVTVSGDASVTNLAATKQTESVGRKYYRRGLMTKISKAHMGGVTFDILSTDKRG